MIQENLIISSVFFAGLLSFFAPCTLPLVPAYIGFLTDERGEAKKLRLGSFEINLGTLLKTMTFVLGLATTFVILGFGAGVLGGLIRETWVQVLAGLVVIILGLHQMEVIHIKRLDQVQGVHIKNTRKKALGTYIMGISFSLGWTPCVGPVLGAVLVVSAGSGSQAYGALLMLVYTLGLMVPFLVLALGSDFLLKKLDMSQAQLTRIKKIGGGLIVLMGLLLMFNQLANITAFFTRLVA